MRAVASKGVLPGHAPIGGSVCMDMCMVDVTDIPFRLGDLAYLFTTEISLKRCRTADLTSSVNSSLLRMETACPANSKST